MVETDNPRPGSNSIESAGERLRGLLDLLAPEATAVETEEQGSVVDELYGAISSSDVTSVANQARAAAERYRNAMRWLVAAVGAVGVVLFGSIAVADIALSESWRWAGLVVAALGLIAILWSAVLMFEPEDASLGELAADFERVGDDGPNRIFSPIRRSLWDLKNILEGDESYAHLGHDSVEDLIESISSTLADRQDGTGEPGADGPALTVAAFRRVVESDAIKRTLVAERLEQLLAYRESLSGDDEDTEEIDELIAAALAADQELRMASLLNLDELEEAVSALQVFDYQLGLDLLHRDLALAESGVAQLRGKFKLSSRVLLVGAAVALIGTTIYIAGIGSASSDGQVVRAGSLYVSQGSGTGDEVKSACLDTELRILLFQDDFPEPGEAYQVTVTDPEICAGEEIQILANREPGDVDLDLDKGKAEVPDDN